MLFNYNKVYNYQYVSVVIPSSSNARVYFPDLPNLREVYTTGIVVYNSIQLPQDPNGLTISNFSGSLAFLTLVENNIERFQQLDTAALNPISNRSGNYSTTEGILSIKPTKFDYSKSYITFSSTFTPTANTVIPIGIYYLYPHEYKALQQQ